MNDLGLVSIITPSYNTADFICDTVLSVKAQNYQNWELIIVDDCSTDNTENVIKPFLTDSRIKFIQNEKNSGAAESRNRALREAKGKWIAFLDSDDLWHPDKLEKQISFMINNGYKFSCHYSDNITEDGHKLNLLSKSPRHITKFDMHNYCFVGCLTAMYDSEYVGLVQIKDIKKNNDYAIWLKVVEKTDCYCLSECLASYRIRTGSISRHSKIALIKWHYRLWHDAEEKNCLISIINTLRNMVFGTYKKLFLQKRI